MLRSIACLCALGLAACAQFPELEGTVAPEDLGKKAPRLLPLEAIDTSGGLDIEAQEEIRTDTSARLSALQARASRLRGPVIDRRSKRRLLSGIDP